MNFNRKQYFREKYPKREEIVFSMIVQSKDLTFPFSGILPEPSLPVENQKELVLLILVCCAESRNQPERGIGLVCDTILNRWFAQRPSWGLTLREVVCKRTVSGIYQFSCMNPMDPNYQYMRKPDMITYAKIAKIVVPRYFGREYQESKMINHYFAHKLVNPSWAKTMKLFDIVGDHTFLIG